MQQCNKHATQQADERLLLHECEALKELLGDAILLNWETETPRLVKILAPARDLFRKLHSAKADFEVEMMPVRYANGVATFDTDLMTAIQSDEEETELLGRALQISVFPAVYKHGDEMGQNVSILPFPLPLARVNSANQEAIDGGEDDSVQSQSRRPEAQRRGEGRSADQA